jgi:hypothetical protein
MIGQRFGRYRVFDKWGEGVVTNWLQDVVEKVNAQKAAH